MKKIILVHNWVIDRFVHIYNNASGYNKILDSFYIPEELAEQNTGAVSRKKV